MENTTNEISYQKKVWIKASIYALIIVLLLLIKTTFNIFILILAGALVAIFFRGISDFICRKTKWKEGICLAISFVGILIIAAGLFFLIGAKLQSQSMELSKALPETYQKVKEAINENEFGSKIINRVSSSGSTKKIQELAGTFFKSTFGVLGDVYVVLFIGIFFTISPQIYKKGVIQLIPKKGQPKGKDVLNKIAENLQKWLKGKLFSMLVVTVMTAIGLAIIGVPMWLVLAIIAGLLSFIPNFGPIIALIPAALVGLMESPTTAAIIVGLYVLIQIIESNFITPLVQQKLVNIPPALILLAQILIGSLTGGWGLLLATPIMVIVIILVQELYIKKRDEKAA
ncbi:AI-2E family transporter [Brumimicrobium glaciale]|uniref:AI-2E family transporter n=1 Tax=Brumimicrobium glaciale TaxID=200475 RepID=A0A4Q4KL02_9FLAO|nr:AI-2E family transporter [Brumimicrobium glaciale]RYM33590.1 AI-2E family transporter [Brumimicrobium glaciale]